MAQNCGSMKNILFYGDNLDIMREHGMDESVDLVYLDPPFNSQRNYNVLFKQAKKDENQAQITAFTDTWEWSKRRYDEFFDDARNARLFPLMNSLHDILGNSEMMAYLLMMAPRLLELHRVLKPTGSLYLHCDPVASHYLKIVLDVVFGPQHFINEITWKRTSGHPDAKRKFADVADILLTYAKSDGYKFSPQYKPYAEDYVGRFYNNADADGRRVKRYLDEMPGMPAPNIWDDIKPVQPHSQERMGYPTQKPLALLDRIINASSSPGDMVLDPFCGCGTAVVAAEKLGRRWIGIDITHVALDLMIARLAENFGLKRDQDYDVLGDPKDAHSAHKLFEQSPKQFEIWAVGLVAGVPQPEKSGDRGVDGKVYFMDLEEKLQFAVVQVKGGNLTPGVLRDFAHVIGRDRAAMGFFICLATPTKGMYREADELRFFESPSGRKIPKLQIRTIKELLEGKEFDFPKGYSLKSAGRKLIRDGEQTQMEM